MIFWCRIKPLLFPSTYIVPCEFYLYGYNLFLLSSYQIYYFTNCLMVSSFKPCISSSLNWYNNTFHFFTTIREHSYEFFLCFSGYFLLECVFFVSLLITSLSSSLPPATTCPSPCPPHPRYFRMCPLFIYF